MHFGVEDNRRGSVLGTPTAERGGRFGIDRGFVRVTAWGVGQVCTRVGVSVAGTRSRRNRHRGEFGNGFRGRSGGGGSFGFLLADWGRLGVFFFNASRAAGRGRGVEILTEVASGITERVLSFAWLVNTSGLSALGFVSSLAVSWGI